MTAKIINLSSYKGHRNCIYGVVLDTYGGKCPYLCSYCYSSQQKNDHTSFKPLSLEKITEEFKIAFETDKNSEYSSILRKKIPIRIGGFVECFSKLEETEKISLQLLKLLKEYSYPLIIITKSNLITTEEYLKELSPKHCAIQVTVPYLKNTYQEILEPEAISITDRLSSIKSLTQEGYFVTARINPLFPLYPDYSFTKNNFSITPPLNIFSLELLTRLKEIGCKNIVAGFIHLNQKQLELISKKLNINLLKYMTEENRELNAGFIYTKKELELYFSFLKESANNIGVNFSPCYLGQEELFFNALKPHFCDPADCCNLQGNIEAIKMTNNHGPIIGNESLSQKLANFILTKLNR